MTLTGEGFLIVLYLAANHSSVWKWVDDFPVGWIMSPAGRCTPIKVGKRMPYAFDNGLYHPHDQSPKPVDARGGVYELCLHAKRRGWHTPLFVVVPDVPYCGGSSLSCSLRHLPVMRELFPDYPMALAVQDGMRPNSHGDSAMLFDWIFVGGSTDWKWAYAGDWCQWAHGNGKKCHVGRVNSERRVRWCIDHNVDAADGTFVGRVPPAHMKRILNPLVQMTFADEEP